MSLDAHLEIAGDGLGVTVIDAEARRDVPLKALVDGARLLAHPGTRLAQLSRRDAEIELTLSTGERLAVPLRALGLQGRDEPEPTVDLLVTSIGQLLTLDDDGDADAGARGAPFRTETRAAVACAGGAVVALGDETTVRSRVKIGPATRVLDAGGRLVTPGLVDPHTHPAFAGDRSAEFALRARGASYQEIAAAGGGIRSTVRATRAATDEALLTATAGNLTALLRHGVTTAEAKSGYALAVDDELRLLRAIRRADRSLPVDLSPTLLGAHVVAPEHQADRDGYVALVCEEMIPRAAAEGLAESVDVYCDEGAFDLAESRRVLEAAQAHGLARRIHAGQFADLGGAGLAAELGAVSADHLEAVSPADMARMAAAGTVAVILPGAAVTLRCPWPPVGALREAGVAIALGTDLNPGTSMTAHLPLMMSLGCMQLGLTVEEAWRAVTSVAARAALRPGAGRLRVGGPADLVLWEATHYAAVPYRLGANLVGTVVKGGRIAVDRAGRS